jgi:hypothetical protein
LEVSDLTLEQNRIAFVDGLVARGLHEVLAPAGLVGSGAQKPWNKNKDDSFTARPVYTKNEKPVARHCATK